jgi:hypothetical protein
MATFPGVEDIDFIPQNMCTLGNTGGAFFSSVPAWPQSHIEKRPPTDFAGYGGAAVLTTEYGAGLGILTGPDNVISFQYGYDHNRVYEGSTFLTYKEGCGAVTDSRAYTPTGVPLAEPNWYGKMAPGRNGGPFSVPLKVQATRNRLRQPPPRRLRFRVASERAKACARTFKRFHGAKCRLRYPGG